MKTISYKLIVISVSAILCLNAWANEQQEKTVSSLNHHEMMDKAYEKDSEKQAMHVRNTVSGNHVMIEEAWLRATPPSQSVSAAFMNITNHNEHDITLVGARVDFAHSVEIHLSSMKDDIMTMEKQSNLKIKAGQTVVLKPGSYHLMIMGLNQALSMRKHKLITLVFEEGAEIDVSLPVKMHQNRMH